MQSLTRYRDTDVSMQQVPHKLIELETLVAEISTMVARIKQSFLKPQLTSYIMTKLSAMVEQVSYALWQQ